MQIDEAGSAPAGGLRIAVDAHVLDGKPQGSRTWLLNTLVRAIPRSPDVHWIIYCRDDSSFDPFRGFANAERRGIPFGSSLLRLGIFWPWVLWRGGVHATLFQYHGPPVFRKRQILVIHDILFETHPEFFPWAMRWRLRILVRFAVARAAGVLTVSRWAKDELVKAYALPSEQIFVVPNAPSIDAVRPRKPDGKTVLFVGRIEPRKNLSLLLDAFGQMHTQDRRIVVVGREDFSSADVLARLQNTPNAVHIPWASDSELADLYATSAVLAFPSSGEGFGIPVVDALNAGLPIIVSSTTAIPEVAGGFARVFNPNASDASEVLADMLDKEIKHPTTPDQDSLASHLATFDWNRSSVKLLEALRFCAH